MERYRIEHDRHLNMYLPQVKVGFFGKWRYMDRDYPQTTYRNPVEGMGRIAEFTKEDAIKVINKRKLKLKYYKIK